MSLSEFLWWAVCRLLIDHLFLILIHATYFHMLYGVLSMPQVDPIVRASIKYAQKLQIGLAILSICCFTGGNNDFLHIGRSAPERRCICSNLADTGGCSPQSAPYRKCLQCQSLDPLVGSGYAGERGHSGSDRFVTLNIHRLLNVVPISTNVKHVLPSHIVQQ